MTLNNVVFNYFDIYKICKQNICHCTFDLQRLMTRISEFFSQISNKQASSLNQIVPLHFSQECEVDNPNFCFLIHSKPDEVVGLLNVLPPLVSLIVDRMT